MEEESSTTRKRPRHQVICEPAYYSDVPVPDLPTDIWIKIMWICESPRSALWLLSSTKRLWHVLKGNTALTRVFQDIKRARKVIDHAQIGYHAICMQPYGFSTKFTVLMWHRDGLRMSMRADYRSALAFDRQSFDLDGWVLLDPLYVPFHWITHTIMSTQPPIPRILLEIDSVCINSLDELVQVQLCATAPLRLLSIDVHTEALCLAAINSPSEEVTLLTYGNFKVRTETVLLAMIKKQVSFLRSVPPSAQTDSLCIAAIKHTLTAYNYIHVPSEAVCYVFIRLNPLAAMQVIPHPSYGMCMTALQMYRENYPTQRTWHIDLCMRIKDDKTRTRVLLSLND